MLLEQDVQGGGSSDWNQTMSRLGTGLVSSLAFETESQEPTS